MVTSMARLSDEVRVRIPELSTEATTPCSLVLLLMAFTRAASASFSWTSKAPMVTPLIAKLLPVVPAAILESVELWTEAAALIPNLSLSLLMASATAPTPFSALLLYLSSTDAKLYVSLVRLLEIARLTAPGPSSCKSDVRM